MLVVLRANTPYRYRPHPFYAVHLGISNVRLYIQLGRSTRVFRQYKFPTPVKLLHSLKIFNKGLMMMMMMMMMMSKRLAQVPMLCLPIYNIKLAMMQTNSLFIPRFQHIRRWPPTSAGKTRCLPVFLYFHKGTTHNSVQKTWLSSRCMIFSKKIVQDTESFREVHFSSFRCAFMRKVY